MDFSNYESWLPKMFYGLCAFGVIYLLQRFKNRSDLTAWFKHLKECSTRAAEDDNFRIRELREAEAEVADNPMPEDAGPIKRNHEYYVHTLPKLLFLMGVGGLIVTYLGLFRPEGEEGFNWMIIAGPLLLLAIGAIILATARMRTNYGYVQRLNRLYIMQKCGKDWNSALATLEKIMIFYPVIPELWLERADMFSKLDKLDEALTALAKSRELAPSDMDLAVIEAGYRCRKGDMKGFAEVVESLPTLRRAETDPRPNVYAAALALKRNDRKGAIEQAEWAVKLDAPFTGRFLPRDAALADLRAFMVDNKIIDEKYIVEP